MTALELDVAILGGGLAGQLLARQLRRELPALRVGIFEKSTDTPYKVGESMVEIATSYFVRRLGLSSYLYDRHYPKNGLRFFFDTPDRGAALEEMSEIGSESLPFHPAFQIDRARVDADLADMNARDGVEVRRGAAVRGLRLGRGGEPHRFTVVEPGGQTDCQARWLADASGRARLVAKQEDLTEPEPELENAAAWARFEGVADIDALGGEPFRARVRHCPRRLATVHFCYPGYWIWFIPLQAGVTSVGVVCEKRVFPAELRSLQGFIDFVKSHRAAGELLGEAKPIDHGCYLNLAYKTKRFFSRDRWGLTGEAACFTDPFYSPGSDFIALENDMLTDLIRRDHAGESAEAVAERAELFDRFMLFRQEATLMLYRGQYSLLGSYEACKLKWDLDVGSYYNLWADAYMRDRHLDADWLESQLGQSRHVLRSLENFRVLLLRVERELRERGDYHRRNLGVYNNGRDCLQFERELGREREEAAILEHQGEIFNRVRSDAAAVLGVEPRYPTLPLRRFMTRHALL